MKKVLIVASVVSFIEWFNKENVEFLGGANANGGSNANADEFGRRQPVEDLRPVEDDDQLPF